MGWMSEGGYMKEVYEKKLQFPGNLYKRDSIVDIKKMEIIVKKGNK